MIDFSRWEDFKHRSISNNIRCSNHFTDGKEQIHPMRDNRFSVVDFDGSNDLIDLPATYGSDNISISTWVNYVDDGATGNIFDTRDAVSDGYVLQVNSSNQVAFKVNGTTNTYTGATFANQWVHIVGTYNGTQIKIYINGELVNTSNLTSTVSTTTNAKIGRRNYNTAEPFQGSISSVAVYNVHQISRRSLRYLSARNYL